MKNNTCSQSPWCEEDRCCCEAYGKRHDENVPMGISQWRAHGEKYQYWEYFRKEIQTEQWEKMRAELSDFLKKELENAPATHHPLRLFIQRLIDVTGLHI